ncbi:hypothetical protein CR513_25827, partial [Mucuna pruriens]
MHVDKYDDTIDLDEHLANYLTQVSLFSNEHAILCRIFLTLLKGLTLHWYTQLPAKSIDSFKMLKKKFDTQNSTNRSDHLTSMALVNFQHEESEPLHSFVAQFLNIFMKIRNLNHEVALHSIIMAQKLGPFSNS